MRPKGAHDIAPLIRGAFIRAAKRLDEKGKSLSSLIEKELENNTLQTLKAVSTFTVKERIVDINNRTVKSVSDLTDEEIEQLKSLATTLLAGNGDGTEEESTVELH